VFDELCKRVISFHFICLKGTHSAVRFICHLSASDATTRSCQRLMRPLDHAHGRNILYLSSRFKLDLSVFKDHDNRSDVLRMFNNYYLNCLSALDKCNTSVLYELLMLRDNVVTFDGDANFLDAGDIDSLTACLSTE
jgi:hypothetical protein